MPAKWGRSWILASSTRPVGLRSRLATGDVLTRWSVLRQRACAAAEQRLARAAVPESLVGRVPQHMRLCRSSGAYAVAR